MFSHCSRCTTLDKCERLHSCCQLLRGLFGSIPTDPQMPLLLDPPQQAIANPTLTMQAQQLQGQPGQQQQQPQPVVTPDPTPTPLRGMNILEFYRQLEAATYGETICLQRVAIRIPGGETYDVDTIRVIGEDRMVMISAKPFDAAKL